MRSELRVRAAEEFPFMDIRFSSISSATSLEIRRVNRKSDQRAGVHATVE
jgi:hypothetical protein